jgi:hypothetical protein
MSFSAKTQLGQATSAAISQAVAVRRLRLSGVAVKKGNTAARGGSNVRLDL